MFKLYVQFLSDAGLLGKTTIGIDGSKFKAVNSKKNNYSQKKIDKYQQFIKYKAEKYLQELDELDKQEVTCGTDVSGSFFLIKGMTDSCFFLSDCS